MLKLSNAMRRWRVCAGCCLAAAGLPAAAAPPGWTPVPAATLGHARGGFTTAAGLEVSLGIERLVTLNGEVVSRTSFHIADVGRLSAPQLQQVQQVQQTGAALSAVKLIQNGSENMVGAVFAAGTLGGTVIQNSLNDQQIQSRTVINSSVNSIGLLKTMNFSASLSDAIARAAGPD